LIAAFRLPPAGTVIVAAVVVDAKENINSTKMNDVIENRKNVLPTRKPYNMGEPPLTGTIFKLSSWIWNFFSRGMQMNARHRHECVVELNARWTSRQS
jgi:hypothetical protein